MSTFLIKVTEQYRCGTESEAKSLLEEAKKNHMYSVIKSSDEIKTVKQKGEVVDEWHRVTITKEFNNEKEPEQFVMPSYQEEDE